MSPANTFHYRPDPEAPPGTAQASFRPDADHIPNIDKAMEHDLQFVQRAGDVVWIPPGWWCARAHCFGLVCMQCACCASCRPAHSCGCGMTRSGGFFSIQTLLISRLTLGTDVGHDRHQVYHATTTVGFASQYMNGNHNRCRLAERQREAASG
jgi:hypothetical protein